MRHLAALLDADEDEMQVQPSEVRGQGQTDQSDASNHGNGKNEF